MTTIYFEGHARTLDYEAGIASGHYDAELSERGRKQAAEEKAPRYSGTELDAVFTSDSQRAYETAQIMFAGTEVPIIRDARLREGDWGDLSRRPTSERDVWIAQGANVPFPNGESVEQGVLRIKGFLDDLAKDYQGKTVLIIGHLVTRWGLEHWINSVPLDQMETAAVQGRRDYQLLQRTS